MNTTYFSKVFCVVAVLKCLSISISEGGSSMAAQAGLKHAATEHAALDEKRESHTRHSLVCKVGQTVPPDPVMVLYAKP